MKRNNYFYKDNQGKNIILSITSTYIDLQAPDGYFYFSGKFDNEIQELARKIIPNEIGKLIHGGKEIANGALERIGKENFPFEKVILVADNKEKDNSYSSELQLFDDESKYFDVISDKNESDIYSEETEIFRKIEGILG